VNLAVDMETNCNVAIKIIRHCEVESFPLDQLREVKVMRRISNVSNLVSPTLSATSHHRLTSFRGSLSNYLTHSVTMAIIVMSTSILVLQMCADFSDSPDLILEYCAFGDLATFIIRQRFQRIGMYFTCTDPP
jgi:serine/threonine protein kinase